MSKHQITPEQVRKIEEALEERKQNRDRRQSDDSFPSDFDRRESRNDRRSSDEDKQG